VAVIDTAELVWGHLLSSDARRVDAPGRGRRFEPTSPPIRLEWDELLARRGSPRGEVQRRVYGDGEATLGGWQVGDVTVQYVEGRVELRASLPKLVTGRNDVVLDEHGVHDGLRTLARIGGELVGHELELRHAVPKRLDYVYQWEVPSVANVVECLKSAFAPARKVRTENVSPFGGRSITWGYGTKRVLRFYDKRAEIAEKAARAGELGRGKERREAMLELSRDFDTLLRFEVQDKRREKLHLVHENGYTAHAARRELETAIVRLQSKTIACANFEALLRSHGDWVHAVAYTAAAFHFLEHPENLTVATRFLSRRAKYAWRRRVREASLAVAEWLPVIAPDAFVAASSLWDFAEAA
jgi:hypothetical protein